MWVQSIIVVTLLAAQGEAAEVTQAQPPAKTAAAKTAISTNPIGLRLGYFTVEAERAVADDLTFFIEPSVIRLRPINELASLRGAGIAVGARWYVVGRAMNGWFVAPELFLNVLALEGQSIQQSRVGAGAGAVLGGSWVLWKHVYGSVGAGFLSQYRGYSLTGLPIHRVATGPTLRFNIGGAF